jgi:cyclohexanone monooxygenase
VEATVEAEDAWVAEIRRALTLGRRFYAECTPGYYNNEGKLGSPIGFFAGTYLEGPVKFIQLLEEWRDDGHLAGVKVR